MGNYQRLIDWEQNPEAMPGYEVEDEHAYFTTTDKEMLEKLITAINDENWRDYSNYDEEE